MSNNVLKLDITVDDNNVEKGALEILKSLRPNWEPSSIKFKVFTEGITNKLVGGYVEGDSSDTVLVRVYGQKTELIIDRNMEMENIQILHSAGCGPPLYCVFNNGVCYAFVHGEPLDEDLVRDNKVKRLIAQEMAKIHSIPAEVIAKQRSRSQLDVKISNLKPEPCIWKKSQKYLDLVPTEFSDPKQQERFVKEVKSKEELQLELDELRAHLENLGSPVVFSHNDLLCKNIIYNDKEEKVTFIDYEYGALNYEAHDIGNHFCEYAGIDSIDYTRFPDETYQLDWLRAYITYYNTEMGQPDQPITDTQVQRLYIQVNKFSLVANFFWGLWALIQAKYSTIDFDYLGYGIIRLNEYFARKEKFFALKLPE